MAPSKTIYEARLVFFANWPHITPTPEALAEAGLYYQPAKLSPDTVRCSHCGIALDQWEPHDEPIKEHRRLAPDCLKAMDAAKPEAQCANNIGFFDPTMQLDLPEFHLFSTSTSFLQNLDAAKYKEASVLAVLAKCLRGPAHKWLKEQPQFSSLASFKTALAAAFPPPSQELSPTSPEPAPHPPPAYHSCLECSTQFSPISRLLAHTQKASCFKLACKHCEEGFSSNNKLHKHVRLKHAQRPATPPASPPSQKSSITPASPPSPRGPLHAPQPAILPFKTPESSVFAAPSSSPSTPLNLPVPSTTPKKYVVQTLGHRLKEKRGKHVNLPLTPPSTPPPPHRPVLQQHQPISHIIEPPRKPYMTIDDLYAMFADKQQKPSPGDIQVSAPSPSFRQAPITNYFKSSPQPIRA